MSSYRARLEQNPQTHPNPTSMHVGCSRGGGSEQKDIRLPASATPTPPRDPSGGSRTGAAARASDSAAGVVAWPGRKHTCCMCALVGRESSRREGRQPAGRRRQKHTPYEQWHNSVPSRHGRQRAQACLRHSFRPCCWRQRRPPARARRSARCIWDRTRVMHTPRGRLRIEPRLGASERSRALRSALRLAPPLAVWRRGVSNTDPSNHSTRRKV